VVLWIHGGGWVLFDIDTYDASCRGVCNKTGAIVVSPDYRRAPEAVFPAAHDDVLTAWTWVRENAAAIGADPARMAIGGEFIERRGRQHLADLHGRRRHRHRRRRQPALLVPDGRTTVVQRVGRRAHRPVGGRRRGRGHRGR
jgi:hypothetical protein